MFGNSRNRALLCWVSIFHWTKQLGILLLFSNYKFLNVETRRFLAMDSGYSNVINKNHISKTFLILDKRTVFNRFGTNFERNEGANPSSYVTNSRAYFLIFSQTKIIVLVNQNVLLKQPKFLGDPITPKQEKIGGDSIFAFQKVDPSFLNRNKKMVST